MDEYISREEVLSRIYATHSTGGFANEEAYLWLHDEITNLSAEDSVPVKQDTELSIILQDYGIKDTDTLQYIFDQYQKIIVDITGGQMSYLTYPAETVIACADDNYRKCHEESMKHGRWVRGVSKGWPTKPSCLWYCSCCGEMIRYADTLRAYQKIKKPVNEVNPYCRKCGAKMEVKQNG